MNIFYKLLGFGVTATVLVACGGGGDGDASPQTDSTASTKQMEAISVVNKGVYAAKFVGDNSTLFAVSALSGTLLGTSVMDWSNFSSKVIDCKTTNSTGGGSYTFTLTQATPRTLGFSAGDKIKIIFNKCSFASQGTSILLNGVVEVTVKNAIVFSSFDDMDISYQVKWNGLSAEVDRNYKIFDGVTDVGFKIVSAPSSLSLKLNVPPGQRLTLTTSNMPIEYKMGVNFLLYLTSKLQTYKLDGDISFVKAGKTMPFSITTSKPISGNEAVNSFNATEGLINVTDLNTGLATSTTFEATKAIISGNNFPTFNSSWTMLSTEP
jgi:hypothetical protein